MKSKFYIHFTLLISVSSAIILFRLLSTSDISKSGFFILKACFSCLILLIVFLAWMITGIYKKLLSSTADTLEICEDLKKLLYDLRDGTKTYYEEKRSAKRIKDCMTIKIVSEDFSEFVKTLNISENGAHFRTGRKLLLDRLIDISIYLSLFPQPINIKARVARIFRSSKDTAVFDVGIKFLNITDTDKEKLTETLRLLDKDQTGEA